MRVKVFVVIFSGGQCCFHIVRPRGCSAISVRADPDDEGVRPPRGSKSPRGKKVKNPKNRQKVKNRGFSGSPPRFLAFLRLDGSRPPRGFFGGVTPPGGPPPPYQRLIKIQFLTGSLVPLGTSPLKFGGRCRVFCT